MSYNRCISQETVTVATAVTVKITSLHVIAILVGNDNAKMTVIPTAF